LYSAEFCVVAGSKISFGTKKVYKSKFALSMTGANGVIPLMIAAVSISIVVAGMISCQSIGTHKPAFNVVLTL
jgi:hypothetical protein